MPMTAAERQAARRQRQADQVASLTAGLADARRRLARSESALAVAVEDNDRLRAQLSSGGPARCDRCQAELACPRCYRAGDDF